MINRRSASFKLDSIGSIILLILFFVALFFILKGVFTILAVVAPVLLIAAFFIDRSVVIGYGKWLLDMVKKNPIVGIGAILLTAVGYTVVFPFLFAKALLKKKVKNITKEFERQAGGGHAQPKDEYVDFEEISSKPNREEPLELPRLDKQSRTQNKNTDYDQFFE